MGTLPIKMPAGPARRRRAAEFLLNIDPGYQRLRHVAKTSMAMVLAASTFEFEGARGSMIAAGCALILMQCAIGRTREHQWRSMLIAAAAQFATLGVVALVLPLTLAEGLKASLAIAGAFAISAGTYFFVWPRSNTAAFVAALQLQFEHTARCLDALSDCLLDRSTRSRRHACSERERVRNAIVFNQRLIDDCMTAPVLDKVRPLVRCMYEALECLSVLDKSAEALSRLGCAAEQVRCEVAAGLREFSSRFQEWRRDSPGAAAMFGDLQSAAAHAPVEHDNERLLLLGTVYWMRRMDAVQRQFVREIAALPPQIIPQR